MFLFIKEILVVGISVVIALLVATGIVPESAVAPDVAPPAVVTEERQPQETKEESQATTTERVSESNVEQPVVEVKEKKPLIDDFEKSLQEALDALAKIEAERAASQGSHADLNNTVRDAVVNILCTTAGAGPLSPISASGVIIDSRGVIVTNAHVAQYFLLKHYPIQNFIECTIRTGSPAKPTYTAELLFLPPSWITKNAHKIDDERPTGNGEHDYALLQITGVVGSGDSLPQRFHHLSISTQAPEIGDTVLLAGYPAGFLGGATIQKELYAASANVKVQELYTYERNTVDLFSINGSIVSQQGSSGGAAAQENGALTGVIVTSSDAPDTASRELRALSTGYIIRDFEKERGVSLATYLSRDLNQERVLFQLNTAPTLSAALISVLEQ